MVSGAPPRIHDRRWKGCLMPKVTRCQSMSLTMYSRPKMTRTSILYSWPNFNIFLAMKFDTVFFEFQLTSFPTKVLCHKNMGLWKGHCLSWTRVVSFLMLSGKLTLYSCAGIILHVLTKYCAPYKQTYYCLHSFVLRVLKRKRRVLKGHENWVRMRSLWVLQNFESSCCKT